MTLKRVTLLILFLISSLGLKGQESFELMRKSVFIDGNTSIGRFSCVYEENSTVNKIYVEKDEATHVLTFQLPVQEFACGNRMLNKDFVKTLKGKDYPWIEVVLEDFYKEDTVYAGDIKLTLIAKEHEIRELPFELKSEDEAGDYLEGGFVLDLNEFEIEPPKKLFGLIKVRNELHVKLRLEVN